MNTILESRAPAPATVHAVWWRSLGRLVCFAADGKCVAACEGADVARTLAELGESVTFSVRVEIPTMYAMQRGELEKELRAGGAT